MKSFKKAALAGCIAAMGLAAAPAYAIPTNVMINHDGVAGFDTLAINEFDWQSSGDFVIVNALPAPAIAGGNPVTTFAAWAAAAVAGDVVTFGIHGHARLNDMLNNANASIAPATLDKDGAVNGDQGFEITAAFSGLETALYLGGGVIRFVAISGTYKYFFDVSPDSDVATGAGFIDGVQMLTGNITSVSGLFDGANQAGSNLIRATVTGYDNTLIETDPLSNAPLIGTTYDTLVTLAGPNQALICNTSPAPNCPIGLLPYNVLTVDLRYKGDANTEFEGSTPEPGTALLLGAGLLGLGFSGLRRRRR